MKFIHSMILIHALLYADPMIEMTTSNPRSGLHVLNARTCVMCEQIIYLEEMFNHFTSQSMYI